jgi:hypothetical protein
MMRSSFGATTSHGAESVSSAFGVVQCNLAAGECLSWISEMGAAPRAVGIRETKKCATLLASARVMTSRERRRGAWLEVARYVAVRLVAGRD